MSKKKHRHKRIEGPVLSKKELMFRDRGSLVFLIAIVSTVVVLGGFLAWYGTQPNNTHDAGSSEAADGNGGSGGNGGGGETGTEVGTDLGEVAPNFHLTDTDGTPFNLNNYLGHVVILDFMATWCGPCNMEMDELNKVQANYSSKGVRIISIDVDDGESSEQLELFKEQHGSEWRFAPKGGSVGRTYGASSIPTLYIIDEGGRVAYKNTGYTPYPTLSEKLDKLV